MSVKNSERVCAAGASAGRGYCGRTAKTVVIDPAGANCVDCLAAVR